MSFQSLKLLAGVSIICLQTIPAFALNDESWVSRTGADGGTCIVTQPCATLSYAIDQTKAGGQVNIMDSLQLDGSLTLRKSISIVNNGAGTATILVAAGIVMLLGDNDIVTFRGLILDGSKNASIGLAFDGGAKSILNVQNCVIRNFKGQLDGQNGYGITFRPHGPLTKLNVTGSTFTENGTSPTGAAIQIYPISAGSAQITIDRVIATNNVFGIAADGGVANGSMNITISNSVISGSVIDGIVATSNAAATAIAMMVKNTQTVNNGYGIRSIGARSVVRVSDSTITGNTVGVETSSGGTMLTFGNNELEANGTNGTFSGTIARK